jgi:hypothetical protein
MRKTRKCGTALLLLCVLGFAIPPVWAQSQEFPVSSHTLKNGMKVLVQPDHSIPNVALYIFYRIGSRNEHPGTTGLSHFFEHMMFNGAKKYGPGDLDKAMEANGASNNAYTSQNVTVYQDWFPRRAIAGYGVHCPHLSMAGRRVDERHPELDDGGLEAPF